MTDIIQGELEFRGYGCIAFDIKGKQIKYFELTHFLNMEEMIKQAYSNHLVYSLHIYKCYSGSKKENIYKENKG